ncbi:MAG: hypothetical protein ACKVS9_05955 [Phycisphaerae bacterium]
MNQREKLMGGLVLGAVGVYAGWSLIQSSVIAPRRALIQQIAVERNRNETYNARIAALQTQLMREWPQMTLRTLAVSDKEAHDKFREELSSLLATCGMTDGHKISQLQEVEDKKKDSPRAGFVELPVSVMAEGKLEQIVDFVRAVQSLPYYSRVNRLSITPLGGEAGLTRKKTTPATPAKSPAGKDGDKKDANKPATPRGGNKADAGRDSPLLKLEMNVSTLVVPKAAGYKHEIFDAAKVDPAKSRRLRFEDPSEYNEIAQVNWFKVYEPPPAPQPKQENVVVAPPPNVETKPVAAAPPPPPPAPVRPNAAKMKVAAVVAYEGQPVAYVSDDSKLTEPLAEIRLNEPIDDGKLVLVDHSGVVVRVAGRTPQEPAKNYFYPLGAAFTQREELDPAKHADVAQLLASVMPPQ